MNAIRERQNAIGPSAASMNGRRRPSGVWKEALQGPITTGSGSAKRPSMPRRGGRYAAVIVSEKARPAAPRPSVQTSPHEARPARLGLDCCAICCEPATDHLEDRTLGARDVLLPVGQLTEHPAGEDLLERPVEDPAR